MRKRFATSLLLVTQLGLCVAPARPTMPQLKLDDNLMRLPADFRYASVQTAKILYFAEDGYSAGTNEIYLVFRDASGYPRIASNYDGHHATFFVENLDEDPNEELIMVYSSGGNQRLALGFDLIKGELVPIEGQLAGSNMSSVEVQNGQIAIRNQQRKSEHEAWLVFEQYAVRDGVFVQIDEGRELINKPPPAAAN